MANAASLTLEQKIGQLFMCGFDGTVPNEAIRTLIAERRIGGIIYFRRNIGNLEEVAKLSADLQRLNAEHSDIPLFISIDQEGGMVSRIDRELALIPGAMALGAAGDEESAYATARISGRELRLLGINMNFAPSVDVNNNPRNPVIGIRSYGEDPEAVGRLGAAAVKGYQDAGVSATIKHFPGHGDTDTDSHLGLPKVAHGKERLQRVELLPFVRAIEAGVDMVMSAHVLFPAYEPEEQPATLSGRVLTDLLRGELGFDGVIVTDCLEMHAISRECGVAEGAVRALEAGADLILVSHRLHEQQAAVQAVLDAVRGGRLDESRIDRSAERILELKRKRRMDAWRENGEYDQGRFGRAEDWAEIRRASERSITLVKNEGVLPLAKNEPTLAVWAEPRVASEVVEIIEQEMTLGKALELEGLPVREIRIGLDPSEAEIRAILEAAGESKQVVVATHNPVAALEPGQVRLVEELRNRPGIRLAVASTRNPYDYAQFPDVPAYLCAYENRPIAMQSLAKVLLGKVRAEGKLPVTLSEKYPIGWGLSR